MALTLFLLGGILVLAHSVETVLGFGCTVVTLALGVHLLPLETLVPILVMLGLLQSIWLVARWHRYIEWRVLLISMLPLAGIGMVMGILGREVADEDTLKMVLGSFIVAVSIVELLILFLRKAQSRPLRWYYQVPLLISGGVFHGLFAAGGPPIVYYASRQFNRQEAFRATLSMLWLALNVGLMIGFVNSGKMDLTKAAMTAMVLPGLVAGIVIGSLIHVKEFWFKALTYGLLFFSGLFLLIQV
jgi:uncharacterized protein